MSNWNVRYPYSFTVQHGSICHEYRYPNFEQYIADLLTFLERPIAGVDLIVDQTSPTQLSIHP